MKKNRGGWRGQKNFSIGGTFTTAKYFARRQYHEPETLNAPEADATVSP